MKKLNLLLATTAILSMGAMTASATDTGNETTSVPVKVEIIPARTLSATALDFGRIVVPVADNDTGEGISQINLSMSSAGVTTITSQTKDQGYNGEAYILKQGTQGVVTGATCAELATMPASVGLNDVSEVTIGSGGSASDNAITLSNIACNTADGKAYIYGDLEISSGVDNIAYDHGIYKGSFTVTAVY